MIHYQDLISLFEKALNEKWGYVWGGAGSTWTQSKQNNAEAEYQRAVANNDKNGIDRWEMTAKYASKWIGKRVADCSGLFSWAFEQLKGYMPHGSNSMWKGYMVNKGTLSAGKRTDGQPLKPGTAVFKLRNGTDYYHVGLYVGGDKVIEAQGTRAGVVTSKISAWHAWGEMKNVSYAEQKAVKPVSETTVYQNAVVKANGGVNMRSTPSKSSAKIATIPNGTVISAAQYDDEWSKVKYGGKEGYAMSEYLVFGELDLNDEAITLVSEIEQRLARLKKILQS